jgi:hypothetical protein
MKTAVMATALVALASLAPACKREPKFPAIEQAVASPVDIASSADGGYFYVLNADFDNTFNRGSILVLDHDGNKVGAVEIPRMGRSITIAGQDMLVTVDGQDDDHEAKAILMRLDDPTKPVQVAEWDLGCSPFNADMREGYPYFAITCIDGPLLLGTLADDRSATTLKLVRNYGITRRAIYIDPKRNLILGFTTDPSKQTYVDRLLDDRETWDDKAHLVRNPDGSSSPNETPDDFEDSRTHQSSKGSRQIHQFFVYDIEREKQPAADCTPSPEDDCTFKYRDSTDLFIQTKELRWLYFKLFNFDGTPDPNSGHEDPGTKYYRTNFWVARPDPNDPDVFYLSHRGPPKKGGSLHANNIIKVTIEGDLRLGPDDARPNTGDVLSFERVYGFRGKESSQYHYPGDFRIATVQGQELLILNHFRDLVNWSRDDVYYSLAAKTLGSDEWTDETPIVTENRTSWYQVALAPDGRAMSCSFYGNSVIMFDVIPGIGIREIKRIE